MAAFAIRNVRLGVQVQVVIPREARFLRAPDDSIWIKSSTTYEFWTRYLDVFSSVKVVARIREVDDVPSDFNRSDGPGVTFVALPYYVGPTGYARNIVKYRQVMRNAGAESSAFLLRVPSRSATSLRGFIPDQHPYGVEVVGDPADVFAVGAVRHPLRPFFRWSFSRDLKMLVGGASTVSYVTREALQRRYPASDEAFQTHYSSIELPDGAFATSYKRPGMFQTGPIRCVTVGSLDQMYKGTDVLLKALAFCRACGSEMLLTVVGDGKHRRELEALSETLGVRRYVKFVGQLPSGMRVQEVLDRSDLFVLPSRTEGLPRAMIEAMARGLPCIGTRVGGIPELLESENLVLLDDPKALASLMLRTTGDPKRMSAMSESNIKVAAEYRSDVLRSRRIEMYTALQDVTESWTRRKI